MNSKMLPNKNIKEYFTADAWTALSEYEKRRYENVQKNYEILKSSGISPKMPEFMMSKFKRSMMNRNKANNGQTKGNQEPKAKFKLFAVPKQPAPKRTNSNKGGSLTMSVVVEMNSISPKAMTTTMINLRGVKPKEFSQKILTSAEITFKALEDIIAAMGDEFSFDIDETTVTKLDYFKDIEPKRRYPKRNTAKKCYKEEDVSSDDEFLYCDICKDEHKGPCPVHGPLLQVCDTKVPKGEPERAKKTLPHFFSLGNSSIQKAGLGVWTEMPLVAGMVFGPYEGAVVKKNEDAKKSGYAWQVRKQTKPCHYVEGANKDLSNWMRYVNCAAYEEWQSVVAIQYKGQIYYKTYKPVLPYTEILVWYGDGYASDLGIELKQRKCLPPPKEITGFSCDVCGSLFSSSESLLKHRKIHPRVQGDKRHRCTECSYSSDDTGHLRKHLLTHTGEKPHACPHCPKRFTQESQIRNHLLLHSGQKEHVCNTCGKRFTQKIHLVKHERVHSGERPYRCSDCGKDFTQASHLKNHLLIHTRQKPHPCPHCEHRSTRSGSLKEHISSIHTRVFPHNCPLCGKGFNAPGKLKKHTDKQHS